MLKSIKNDKEQESNNVLYIVLPLALVAIIIGFIIGGAYYIKYKRNFSSKNLNDKNVKYEKDSNSVLTI